MKTKPSHNVVSLDAIMNTVEWGSLTFSIVMSLTGFRERIVSRANTGLNFKLSRFVTSLDIQLFVVLLVSRQSSGRCDHLPSYVYDLKLTFEFNIIKRKLLKYLGLQLSAHERGVDKSQRTSKIPTQNVLIENLITSLLSIMLTLCFENAL